MTHSSPIKKLKKSNLTPRSTVRKETSGKSRRTVSPTVNTAGVPLPPTHSTVPLATSVTSTGMYRTKWWVTLMRAWPLTLWGLIISPRQRLRWVINFHRGEHIDLETLIKGGPS